MGIDRALAEFVAHIFDATSEDLDLIQKAVNSRRQFLTEMRAHEIEGSLYEGDWVAIVACNTKYYIGLEGKVVGFSNTGVKVEISHTGNAKHPGRKAEEAKWKTVSFAPGCLEKQ